MVAKLENYGPLKNTVFAFTFRISSLNAEKMFWTRAQKTSSTSFLGLSPYNHHELRMFQKSLRPIDYMFNQFYFGQKRVRGIGMWGAVRVKLSYDSSWMRNAIVTLNCVFLGWFVSFLFLLWMSFFCSSLFSLK